MLLVPMQVESIQMSTNKILFYKESLGGMVGWCEGVLYLRAPGRPIDIGLQLGKACYPCSR